MSVDLMQGPVEQGVVVSTVHLDTTSYDKRKINHDGTYPGRVATENSETVQRGDICCYSDRVTDARIDNGAPVFASFNGFGKTRQELKDSITVAGVARTDCQFREKNTGSCNFSVLIGGQCVTRHTGKVQLNKGDLVKVSPPKEDLSDCAKLPSSAGPTEEQKVRLVTKRESFNIHKNFKKTLSKKQTGDTSVEFSNPVFNHEQAHSIEHSLKSSKCSTWLAVKTPAVVALSMQPFITKLLYDHLLKVGVIDPADEESNKILAVESVVCEYMYTLKVTTERTTYDVKEEGLAFAGTEFPFLFGQFCSVMLGIPWVEDDRLAFNYKGDTLDLAKIREATLAEFKKRLNSDGARSDETGFGNSMTTDIRTNSFLIPKEEVRKRHWTEDKIEIRDAVNVVDSYSKLAVHDTEVSLRRKSRRLLGKVVEGGTPGLGMTLVLQGTRVATAF